MDKPKGAPFEPGVVARVAAGIRYAITGQRPDWFGPAAPLAPMAPPEVKGRAFDYPMGLNLQSTPRRDGMAGVDFATLRALADGYDLLRLVIETRKDQIEKLSWVIRPRIAKGRTASKAHIKRAVEAEQMLRSPDRIHSFPQWLRMAVEEVLVTDALTIYPRPTRGGGVYSLDLIDGTTIKPLIDQSGRPPAPPEAAYQQVIKGLPVGNFTRDELLYIKANPRVHKLYGYSPVEQIITTVNIALRRQTTQLSYFTEGNVPEALVGMPAEWTMDQIREFQNYWDSLLAGNAVQQRRMKFVPGEVAKAYVPTREPVIKDVFDEWLARVVCFAFSIPPTAFVAQVNRSVAETAMKQAMEEGILPLMQRLEWVFDRCLEVMGYADCDFAWDQSEDENPLQSAQVDALLVEKKIATVNEVRERRGWDPVAWGDEPPAPPPQLAPGADGREGKTKPETKPGTEGEDYDESQKAERPAWVKKVKRLAPARTNRPFVSARMAKLARAVHRELRAKAAECAAALDEFTGHAAKADDDDRARGEGFAASHDFGDWSGVEDAVSAYAAEVFEEAGRAAVVALGARVDGAKHEAMFEVVHDDAVRIAKRRAAALVKDIPKSTRDMLRGTVVEALKQGWSSDKLAAEIAKCPAFDAARSETIARTELAIANSEGYRAGLDASGVVIESKEWLLGEDDPCDECQGNADQGPIAYTETFQSGHAWTTAHPRCCCDIAVIPKE